MFHPGQGHLAAACSATQILCCAASLHMIKDVEDRLRALQHVCLALPRTAQALYEQVRPLSCTCTVERAAPNRH